MVLRNRNSGVVAKIETSPGTFEEPSADTDGILIEVPTISPNPQNTETAEVSGSLDSRSPIVGGMQMTVSFTAYLKGQGTPGVPPEYGDLLRTCGLAETITKTDIQDTDISFVAATSKILSVAADITPLTVGTPFHVAGATNSVNNNEFLVTAVAAGEVTVSKTDGSAAGLTDEAAGATITLRYGIPAVTVSAGSTTGFTAIAPWAATADLYRGMPVLLSTNPVTPEYSFMNEYSVARLAEIIKTMSGTLDNTTNVAIPANVLYIPASASIPACSMVVYRDGTAWKLTGCRGTVRKSFDAGGAVKAEFTMSGLFVSKTDVAIPAITYDATRPGSFRNSQFVLARKAIGTSTLAIDIANTLVFPPNPNNSEGFDTPEITARRITGTVDPSDVLVATRDIMTDFRAGTAAIMHARLTGGPAANAGQRIGLTVPEVFYTGNDPGDRDGIATEEVSFFCQGEDSGIFLCLY